MTGVFDYDHLWECECGETDITTHDLATVIAHTADMPLSDAKNVVMRMDDRIAKGAPALTYMIAEIVESVRWQHS